MAADKGKEPRDSGSGSRLKEIINRMGRDDIEIGVCAGSCDRKDHPGYVVEFLCRSRITLNR
jgi:hypothetical protein